MMENLEKLRNIGIIAHIDAGKTTTTERVLFLSGRIHRFGNVDDGNTTTDYMDQERERGITIVSAATAFDWKGYRINLIDTPGHVDFTAEVERSLRVLDGVVIVLCGVAGVQPQTETVWRQANRYGVPRIVDVNKMDRIGANLDNVVEMIRTKLGATPAVLHVPIGIEDTFIGMVDVISGKACVWNEETDGTNIEVVDCPEDLKETVALARMQLIDVVAESDEEALSIFIENGTLTNEQIKHYLRKACIATKLVPVVCASAFKHKGVQPLLDAVVDYLPNPLEVPEIKGINPKTGEQIVRKSDPSEPLSALVFKVVSDPYLGTLSYVRVYSGKILASSHVTNATTGKKERVMRCLHLFADHREDIPELLAGDIGGVLGLKESHTGNTLYDTHPIALEDMVFPEPVITMAVEPMTKGEQDKVNKVLRSYSLEDPTFVVKTDEETGEIVVSGMGELRLDIMVERLKREHKLELRTGTPQVSYKETLGKSVDVRVKHVKQTGGKGQYADVAIEFYPAEAGSGLVFESKVGGDIIPQQFIKDVEQGIKDGMQSGVMLGYPVVDIGARLVGGSYHEVDSSNIAFRQAANKALKDALRKGDPQLLEPVMKLQVITPEEYLGDVMAGLNKRRCKVQSMDLQGTSQVIDALAPLSEMFGYATDLRSSTQGRGTHTMQFSHMQITPPDVRDAVVLKVRGMPWQP